MITMRVGDWGPTFDAIDRLIAGVTHAAVQGLEWYGLNGVEHMKANHDHNAHRIGRYINRTLSLTRTMSYQIVVVSDHTQRLIFVAPMSYAEAVEYGTPKSAPYPFFWPAINELHDFAVQRLTDLYMVQFEVHDQIVRRGRL